MSWLRRWWARTAAAAVLPASDSAHPDDEQAVAPRTARDWTVDAGAFVIAVALGALLLRLAVDDTANRMTSGRVATDAAVGALCCISLWWRRRWPLGVALACVLLGAFSTFGTAAGLFALSSLAVHRPIRPAVFVSVLFVPSAVVCSIWLGRSNTWSVILPTLALASAATAWGMFIRARRQLLSTLRDRAERAEADRLLHAERARLAERTRIAREMHDVLAHRISLVALHAGALEVARDVPPAQVRESAALLRTTAHQALEELRDVIGVLREEPGKERPSTVPQPTLSDIPRLVEETRRSGTKIDFEMQVDGAEAAPGPLGRDAYRIVQEALTNVAKHARGTLAQVRVAGAPDHGLHVSVRNPTALGAQDRPAPPGSGTGLLGLQERVTLANGVLVHGPNASGDFVVEADLPW
ncbi:MAG TPA: histidine kinase [Microthrixaceae bacterium]|nr:histidine kinase [Microthrixaceae bacterium]HMT59919.1 histidine kinase [Microthrixaceae bacterium]